MNITDLIVELLEKGQKVEITGIGSLDSVMQNAHHDPATRIYYPASRIIAFNPETTGDTSIIKELAARECISEDVAKQMWLNYVDALADKLKRSGRHTMGRLGDLTCDGKREYGFTMTEGLVLDAGNKGEVPIEEVKIYSHDNEEDPFAQFDVEVEKVSFDEPKPEPAPAPEPAPVAAPAPEPAPTTDDDAAWKNELKQLDEIGKAEEVVDPKEAARAEKERLKAEKKAEEERLRLEKKAEEDKRRAEEQIAKERAAAEKREAEEKRRAEEELRRAEKKAEEERRKAEKEAEHSRIKAEKEAEKERIKAEKKAAALAAVAAREQAKADLMAQGKEEKEAAIQAALAEKQRKAAEKEVARREKEAAAAAKKAQKEAAKATADQEKEYKEQKEEGKKRVRLLPILLILLVLLLGAGAAYVLLHRNGTPAGTEMARSNKHLKDVGPANSLTYNTDLLSYNQREVMHNSDLVCRYLNDYINQYLADRGYTSARVPMMDRVRQYSTDRLGELMGERFAVQRLIPYNDYIYQYNEPYMRIIFADKMRHQVQGELMNYRSLDDLLYRMVDELGLQPDGQGGKSAAEVREVKATEQKIAAEKKKNTVNQPTEAPVYVYVEKGSKQGYDLIAGFYLNKATAAKQTARLHELGCDAYIIEFSDMYYVSMGSASSQTSADALLKHIKSWYDGDVVIKKW